MNERERGIAAYRATTQKTEEPKRRKRKSASKRPVELTVELSGAKPGGAEPAEGGRAGQGGSQTPRGAAEQLIRDVPGKKGYRKVAKLLLLLGKEEAAGVLKHFDEAEVEAISREIAAVKRVDRAEAERLLGELGLGGGGSRPVKAGPDRARAMLTAAFGARRADQLLKRVVPETRERPFQFLADIDHHQILLLLKNESAPTVSVVLPYLPPQKAARVLQGLSPELQKSVLRRIATMKKVDPAVIVSIEGVLKERIRTQGRLVTEEIDGREALANILKHLDYAQEEKILEEIASYDPELSGNVKERLFTIELIFKIADADLQAILRDYDDEEIATVLKAKEQKVQDRILTNLSDRRRTIVREEMLRLGKMRKTDVDAVTKDFVDYLVDLDDQRKIAIDWGDQVVE